MKKIVVAVDGSQQALQAARMGADLATQMAAKLVLVHVVRPPVDLPWDLHAAVFGPWEREKRAEAAELLSNAADFAGIEAERVILQGAPAEAIAHFARAPDIELVLVGSRGRGAATRVLLGSVSDRLVHICDKPVMVVR